MSMELMVKAMKIKVGNPLRKLVLLKLADNANDQGECWPSYKHIAEQCEIGRSTVKSHVRALEEMGILTREYRRNGELNQSNLFHLQLEEKSYSIQLGGGAGADLGQHVAEVGQELTQGGAGADLGGGAGADPRISHSFEPVIEPVIEPKLNGASADASAPTRPVKRVFSPEFEMAWQAYPKRAGGNSKTAAFKAWNARLKEGVTPEAMHEGVKRYAAYAKATGSVGTQYIKQAATFFGPDRHFVEAWNPPLSAPGGRRREQAPVSGFRNQDYGDTDCNF